jgi:hypothetical protein
MTERSPTPGHAPAGRTTARARARPTALRPRARIVAARGQQPFALLRWRRVRNRDIDSRGEYIRNSATHVWSGSESGFSFESDPLASGFATTGHERNGVLLRLAGDKTVWGT